MATQPVYIAGVGSCHSNSAASNSNIHQLAVAAATKALLDAGVTYDDINHNTAGFLDDSSISKASFDSFGKTGVSVGAMDCHSVLFTASQFVRSGQANCSLLIGFDKESNGESGKGQFAVIAIVLVSDPFLTSHAYLKDSSISIHSSEAVRPVFSRTSRLNGEMLATRAAVRNALQHAKLGPEEIQIVDLRHESSPTAQQALSELGIAEDGYTSPISKSFVGITGLAALCELVWQLRGWTRDESMTGAKNCLQYIKGPDGTAYVTTFGRADGKMAPKWEEIEFLRDGRERLGHNPAVESKDISYEDWMSVKARDEHVPDNTGKNLGLRVKGGDRAALARL